jgi:hypothetical protein
VRVTCSAAGFRSRSGGHQGHPRRIRALADELSAARYVHLDVSKPKQWDTSVGVEVWMPGRDKLNWPQEGGWRVRSKLEQFAAIRRDRRIEGLSIRALADKHHVHRRTVRQALESAIPPARKTPQWAAPQAGADRICRIDTAVGSKCRDSR